MKILQAYPSFFETRLQGRYVTLDMIIPLLESYKNEFEISEIGSSELGKKIPMITIGSGQKKVLAWSQMHGNETTTTKAIFDFLKFLGQKDAFQDEITEFLQTYTCCIIPILNPDGAVAYTRENSNGVDLNRDAQQLSQAESRVLADIFKDFKPDLCLNLHDQRTIYGFKTGKSATVSFLAPAADQERSITPSRKTAMQHIAAMSEVLQGYIPDQIGRYDDTFNSNCVGDTFQKAGVPTILFEAGHYHDDYTREQTRKYIWYSFVTLFGFVAYNEASIDAYHELPENIKNHYDVIIKNVYSKTLDNTVSVAIQYNEVLKNQEIVFVPCIEAIGNLGNTFGHREIDAKGTEILINSQRNYQVGEKVSEIINKKDNSLLYINEL